MTEEKMKEIIDLSKQSDDKEKKEVSAAQILLEQSSSNDTIESISLKGNEVVSETISNNGATSTAAENPTAIVTTSPSVNAPVVTTSPSTKAPVVTASPSV